MVDVPTGLLIRDFFKQYRELRYSSQGSIDFSEIEVNAYRMSLTLEVTHMDGPRYGNLKSLPENTHYGYVTTFRGSTVEKLIPIKFAKQRVFDIINQGIWNYHHGTEAVSLDKSFSEGSANAVLQSGLLSDAGNKVVSFFIEARDFVEGEIESAFAWLFGYNYGSGTPGGPGADVQNYRALPIASPFPTVCKFKADVPLSFLWRLELWYLVDPAVYIVDNPTDSGDETDGEDEYPTPDSEGPVPPSSLPGVGLDPRDFSAGPGGNLDPNTAYLWHGTGSAQILGSNTQTVSSPVGVDFTYQANGAPFTVRNGPTVLNTQTATTYYSGLIVVDRFGQTVFSKYQGVGFTAQTIAMNFTVEEIQI